MASIDNALIVGAGIGGLAQAAAFAQRGIEVDIVEVRPHSDVLGVGINQPANSLRALQKLGVLDEILAIGFEFELVKFYDYKENLITDVPQVMGDDDVPANAALTRRDLHNILIAAGEKQGVEVRYGTTVREWTEDGDHVDVTFSDGSHGAYDLVVGFDGIKSELRRQLFGAECEPVYTGYGVWRLKVPRPEHIRYSAMYMGVNAKAGYIPLNEDEMYLLHVTPEPEDLRYERDDLVGALRSKLAGFEGVIADIRENLRPGDDVAYGLLTEVLLPAPWHKGRVMVLGDAAHAAVPHMTQGAGMAIEDAVVLAEELDTERPLDASLEAFTARRQARVKFVQDVSRLVMQTEMKPTSQQILDELSVELREHLAARMAAGDNFLKQPA